MKKIMDELTPVLKRGAVHCPDDNEPLEFEIVGVMRVVRDGYYTARCQKCGEYYKVIQDKNINKVIL